MADINLLIKKSESRGVAPGTRKLILRGSLVVLTGYILISAGFLGWSVYSSLKKQQVSQDLSKLTSQVAGFAKEEVLIRRMDDRSKLIVQLLQSRPNLPKMAQVVADSRLTLKTWDVTAEKQQIAMVAPTSAAIQGFVSDLKNSYQQVELVSLVYRQTDGWIGTIAVGGLIQ